MPINHKLLVSVEDLDTFFSKIVIEQFPDEEITYEVAKDSLLADAVKYGRFIKSSGGTELRAADPDFVKMAIEFYGAVSAIVQLLSALHKSREKTKELNEESDKTVPNGLTTEQLSGRWKALMVAEGVSPEKAETLAHVYALDLQLLVSKSKA